VNGYEFYCAYHAVKLHFMTDSYDYFKYNGKTNAKPHTYEKRNDKYMFHRLARNTPDEDVIPFLVSNFLIKQKCWTKELLEPEAQDIFHKWKKTYESLTYTFGQDVEKILADGGVNDMLRSRTGGEYPKVFVMMNQGDITLETVVILNILTGCVANWDKVYSNDYHYSCVSNLIKKYTPFLQIDTAKFKNIVRKHLTPAEV